MVQFSFLIMSIVSVKDGILIMQTPYSIIVLKIFDRFEPVLKCRTAMKIIFFVQFLCSVLNFENYSSFAVYYPIFSILFRNPHTKCKYFLADTQVSIMKEKEDMSPRKRGNADIFALISSIFSDINKARTNHMDRTSRAFGYTHMFRMSFR